MIFLASTSTPETRFEYPFTTIEELHPALLRDSEALDESLSVIVFVHQGSADFSRVTSAVTERRREILNCKTAGFRRFGSRHGYPIRIRRRRTKRYDIHQSVLGNS